MTQVAIQLSTRATIGNNVELNVILSGAIVMEISNVGTKLVYGIGINDADYVTKISDCLGYVDGKRKRKLVWYCPFYAKWRGMLQRCYSEKLHEKYPTYKGCSVIEEWLTFSEFKSWMETQEWEGKQLDKDILFPNNKIYSPEACVFVDQKVNSFILESTATRGEWPLGVYFNKQCRKFIAKCWSVTTGKREHLGIFKTPEEAHQAWLTFKLEQAYILAAEQTDERVAKALIDKYENFTPTEMAA
jgi:hypothetical protein